MNSHQTHGQSLAAARAWSVNARAGQRTNYATTPRHARRQSDTRARLYTRTLASLAVLALALATVAHLL